MPAFFGAEWSKMTKAAREDAIERMKRAINEVARQKLIEAGVRVTEF